jgi:GT2 family glycosyltransferase
MNNIDLSIIIIASKGTFIFDCLKSLQSALKSVKSEIILIDNVSQDNVGTKVKKQFPEVKVLRRTANGGFGENNNMGMKIAKGRYVLLLNDDTKIIDKNIFREMIQWMDEHSKAGTSTCALVNPDMKTYQGSGGYFPTLGRVFAWMTFLDDIPLVDKLVKPYHPLHGSSPFYKNSSYFKKEHKQDWLTGAFFMMRKEAMDEAGIFDEDFFLYVEEVELAYRFALKGWEAWYLPHWKTVHFGMATNGSEKATIFEMQNLKLFYSKHFPAWQMPILNFLIKMGTVLRILLYSVMDPAVAKIYVKAFREV